MKKWMIFAVCLMSLSLADALAFPGWIGVYNGVPRHEDDANPGAFTVMMNQDYYGLHARVGMRVNNGFWREFEMRYTGQKDINSVWQFTPAFEFPPGARVEYYFKGYDGTGQVIYDNIPGADYHFYAAPTPALLIRDAEHIGYMGDEDVILTTVDGVYKCSWRAKTSEPEVNQLILSFKPQGDPWRELTPVYETAHNDRTIHWIRASGDKVLVHTVDFGSAGGTYRSYVHRSEDGGMTWLPSLVFPNTVHHLYPQDDRLLWFHEHEGSVYGMPFNGADWSTPVPILPHAAQEVVQSGQTIVAAAAEDREIAVSFDGGASWKTGAPASLEIRDAITASAEGVYVVGEDDDPSTSGGQIWKCVEAGSSWDLLVAELHEWWRYSAGEGDFRVLDDETLGLISLGISNGGETRVYPNYQISSDRVTTWRTRSGVALATNAFISGDYDNVDMHDGSSALVVRENDENEDGERKTYVMRLEPADVLEGRLFWLGDVYHWPPEPAISSTEDLWINASVWPAGNAMEVSAAVSITGPNVVDKTQSIPMEMDAVYGDIEVWHANLGKLAENTRVVYSVMATDRTGTRLLEEIVGRERTVQVDPKPIYWAGNVRGYNHSWHGRGSFYWFTVQADTWPKGGAVAADIIYSFDGNTWHRDAMAKSEEESTNDVWQFRHDGNPGSSFRCAIWILDGEGREWWLTNNGYNYWPWN